MDQADLEKGMDIYEQIVNSEASNPTRLPQLVEQLEAADDTGQYLCSASRYLSAMNPAEYSPLISRMVETAIDRDRERRYISQLLPALWGDDYMLRAEQLKLSDNNFRRIYKRIHPA